MALTLHEAGLHPCGHPSSLTLEGFNEGLFEVREGVCLACAALDQYRRTQEGRAREPGHTASVVNLLRPGDDFRFWSGRQKPADAADHHGHEATEGEGDEGDRQNA